MSSHIEPLQAGKAATVAEAPSPLLAKTSPVAVQASVGVGLLAVSALVLIFAPLIHLPLPLSEFDQKRLMQMLLLAVAASAFAASPDLRRHVAAEVSSLPTAGLVATLMVLALGVASSLTAASPRHAFGEMGLLFALVLYSLTLAGALRPVLPAARHWFAIALVVMMSLCLVRTAGAYIAWLTTVQLDVGELLVGLGNKRFFGHWLTLSLPLAVLPVLLLRSPWARAGALLLACGWWALTFGAGGRGTLLGVGVAMGFTALTVPRARGWFALQLLCALAGFALAYALFELPTQASPMEIGLDRLGGQVGTAGSNQARLVLLVESAALILEHPLLGIGPMHFAAVGERGHPHNLVAQLAVEWGLPASALIIALALGAAIAWWRLLPGARSSHVIRPALAASLLAGAIHALLSGVLVPAYSQLWVAVLAGFALCEFNEMLSPYGREHDRRADLASSTRYPARSTGLLLGAAWLACLGALATMLALDGPLVVQSMRAAQTREVAAVPRFWQYGYIDEGRSLSALVHNRPLRERPRYTLEATLERAHLPLLSE